MIIKPVFVRRYSVSVLLIISAVLLYSATAYGVSPVSKSVPLRFGSVAMDIPAVMHKRLVPLTRYLSRKLGRPVKLVLSPDMKHAINNIVSGKVDFAYLTPVAYIRSRLQGKTRLVAKTVTAGKGSFRLMIVVRKNSGIKTIKDLQGKTFAFGDPAALLQRAVVSGANVSLANLRYRFLGHYDNIVRAVLNHDYDAGILKDSHAYKWQSRGIRVLYASPALPPYNIAANHKVNDRTLQKIRAAFLALNNRQEQHRRIIKALSSKYTGFTSASDSEYDIVRTLIKPFRK